MPAPFFRIEMLPAKQGDALWIEYGKGKTTRRMLIDGGPISAYDAVDERLQKLEEGNKRVELLVISHVDTDHIEGVIRLLAARRTEWPIMPVDIWFNGWRHLQASEMLGGREGDFLSALISRRAFTEWNKAFKGKAVVIDPDKPLPVKTLKDEMKLTLLSPIPDKLEAMADVWTRDVEKHGLEPGDLDKAWKQLVETAKYQIAEGVLGGAGEFGEKLAKQLKPDPSKANGASIAFLAEYAGKSCLFLADAHADVVCESIKKLIPAGQKRLKVDAVKLSHHGSKYNLSEELVSLIDARHFLISTDSSKKQKHPDKEAIEAVLRWAAQKPTLWFNYRTKKTEPWANASADSQQYFPSKYPPSTAGGIVIDL
jgi:beta-lactamase superfamily II metal-dependent hydrolase